MELNPKTIQAAVVDRLAADLIDQWDWREEARTEMLKRIDVAFKAGVNTLLAETVQKAVQDGFDHAYTKVDTFGRKNGETTNIRAELDRLITGYWTQIVDRNGKPSADSYGDKTTRAEWHMIQVCGEGFSKNLKQEVVNITAGFKDGLRVQLRGSMDKMLNDLFKVKSSQDAAEKLY